jgi:anti-sigma regulatory factor (Ser/Thr protein kinase)
MDLRAPICVSTQDLGTLRIRLPAHPASAGAARQHVKAVIHARNLDIDDYVAALLASELVTNALMHGLREDGTIQLVITTAESWMRVTVHDCSPSVPVLMHTPLDAEDGRGLTLLDNLAASWGFQRSASGKAVYFTLKAEGGEERPAGAARDDHQRSPHL